MLTMGIAATRESRLTGEFPDFNLQALMSQTAQNTVRIPSPSDHSVVQLMDLLSERFEGGSFNINSSGRDLGSFSAAQQFFSAYDDVEWTEARIINRIQFNSPSPHVHVVFQRWVTDFSDRAHQLSSQWEAEIYIFFSSNPVPDPDRVLAAWQVVDDFRKSLVGGKGRQPRTQDDLSKVMGRQLAGLTELHARILHDAEQSRINGENRLAEREAQLEERYEARRSALEEQIEQRRQEVSEEEKTLEEKRQALDDRSHMHARRELRTRITDDLKARLVRPGVSLNTTILRLFVGAVALAGALGFSIYAFASSQDFHAAISKGGNDYIAIIVTAVRFALPVAGAVGLLFYLLGWLRQIHQEDVRAERDLERYRYDIDRASWAIETILEAQEKKVGDVPAEWVHGVTHNLFARSEGRAEDVNPLEALGALLNVAAKAEIGPNGPRLEITKPGLKKIGQAAAEQ